MKKILITGVGGGVGQSILKSLSGSDYLIYGADSEFLAAGLYVANKSFLVPYAKDDEYIPSLLNICKEEKIDLLFPGLDAELKVLAQNINCFKSVGTQLVISSPGVVELSDNKMALYDYFLSRDIFIPKTIKFFDFNPDNTDFVFPIITKQMVGGERSKNVFKLDNQSEFNKFISTNNSSFLERLIIQEYIEGDEYTCGTVSLDGVCKGVIVMRRILRNGDTYKCFTIRDRVLEEKVKLLIETIKPFGACNVQLKLKDGEPYIFEINARCSGTTASRALCGFNEPKMIADFLLQNISPEYEIKEKTVLRYWNELLVDNQQINILCDYGTITNNSRNL